MTVTIHFERLTPIAFSKALGVRLGSCIVKSACCLSLFFSAVSIANGRPVGEDLDHKGCRAAAGYIWSAVKGSCIRLFEVGLAFTPDQSQAGSSVQLAYVVIAPAVSGAHLAAEAFMPGEGRPIALKVVRNPEGDTRATLLVNEAMKIRVFRVKDDHFLEFKGLRYRRISPVDDPLFQLR
jgi:hypothetical protein